MSSVWDRILEQKTKEQLLTPPVSEIFKNIPGGSAGLDRTLFDAAFDAVFTRFSLDPNSPDSLVAKAGAPSGFGAAPGALSPDVFASWHTAYQAEYIAANAGAADQNGILTIGSGPTAIHVTLSSTQDKVYILESLQPSDFATMSFADQTRIARSDVFLNQLSPEFGLVPGPYDTDGPDSPYQKALADINGNTFVSADERSVFTQELNLIKAQAATMGIVSPTNINSQVKDIQDRFDRLAAFAEADNPTNAETQPPALPPPQFVNVIGLDAGSTVHQGRQNFANAERQILAASSASFQLATTGTVQGLTKHLDAPELLAIFQENQSLIDAAKNAGDTELINQTNELLKTYSAIQDIISQTLATFDASNSGEKRGLLGYQNNSEASNNSGNPNAGHVSLDRFQLGANTPPNDLPQHSGGNTFFPPKPTDAQLKVISMFEQDLGGIAHPIEKLLNIKRPGFDFYDNKGGTLNYFEKSTYDQWSASLGNTVQQISEQNQLTFNDINTREKQRTAETQSAQDALTKLSDILSTMTRNLA